MHTCGRLVGSKDGGCLGITTSQLSLLAEFQTNERPCLKKARSGRKDGSADQCTCSQYWSHGRREPTSTRCPMYSMTCACVHTFKYTPRQIKYIIFWSKGSEIPLFLKYLLQECEDWVRVQTSRVCISAKWTNWHTCNSSSGKKPASETIHIVQLWIGWETSPQQEMWKSDWGWVITPSSHVHSCVRTDASMRARMHMTHTRRKKNRTIGRIKIIHSMIKELILNWQGSQEVNPVRNWLWWLASCQLDTNETQLERGNLDW